MSVQLLGASRNQIARAASKYFNRELGMGFKAKEISPILQQLADEATSAAVDVDVFKRSGKMTSEGRLIVKQILKDNDISENITIKDYFKDLYSKITKTSTKHQDINPIEAKLFA